MELRVRRRMRIGTVVPMASGSQLVRGPFHVASSTRTSFVFFPLAAPAGGRPSRPDRKEARQMLEETQEREEIIERVAALDIGKAELVRCVRVPGPTGTTRRVQEVGTYKTMTKALLAMSERLAELGSRGW
jgi:hypothetical protein